MPSLLVRRRSEHAVFLSKSKSRVPSTHSRSESYGDTRTSCGGKYGMNGVGIGAGVGTGSTVGRRIEQFVACDHSGLQRQTDGATQKP